METKSYKILVGQSLKGATEVNAICTASELLSILRGIARYETMMRKTSVQAFVECEGKQTTYFMSKDFLDNENLNIAL